MTQENEWDINDEYQCSLDVNTYFPITAIIDGKEVVFHKPEYIPSGRAFRVIKVNRGDIVS